MPRPVSELVQTLNEHGVRYLLVGGAALELHGSSYVTQDVDIVYERSPENVQRLVRGLAPFEPRYRVQGEPGGLPMSWHERTILNGDNFTLTTTVGDLALVGTVAPEWRYSDLVERFGARYDVDGLTVDMLTLEGLRETKRAAGRPKDHLVIPEIEAMIEARDLASEEPT